MKKNGLSLIIAVVFSLVVSVPRVLFLLNGRDESVLNSVVEVSAEDTIVRILLLFGFSFIVLKFNLIWIEKIKKKKRLWASLVINLLILLIWVLIFYIINSFVYPIFSTVLSPGVNFIVYFFFLVLLALASKAITLVEKSKLDALEKEILKRKSIENELEALKNQINPHFLFNSLNTLSLLVREDQKAAGKFINKLSFLFRYILQSQEESMATVKEELKVLESYTHLIKQRYQANFYVSVHIDAWMLQRKMPILALQMLMENAVKHNEISDKNPLHMEFYNEGKWIVGKNILQKRSGNVESTNTGLKNLNTRTKIQMDEEIQISKDNTHFIVKIPTQ